MNGKIETKEIGENKHIAGRIVNMLSPRYCRMIEEVCRHKTNRV